MSKVDYAIRGGRGNTAMNAIKQAKQTKKRNTIKRMYEDLISRREQGAKILYDDAVNVYGDGVKEFIPPMDLYYNDEGLFEPHKYAKSVKVGLDKYKEARAKQEEELRKKEEEEAKKQRLIQQQEAIFGAKPNTAEEAYRAGAFSTIGEPLEEGAADLAKHGWPGQRDLWQNYRAGQQDIVSEEDINRLIASYRTRKTAIESQLKNIPKVTTDPQTLEAKPNPQYTRLQNELDQLDIDINAMKSKRKQIAGNRYKQAEEELQRKREAEREAAEAAAANQPPPEEDKGWLGNVTSTIGGWFGGENNDPAPAQSGPKPGDVEQGFEFIGGDPADPQNWRPVGR
jgi:hypothetical protein